MGIERITTPDGETRISMTLDDYEELLSSLKHAKSMQAIAMGTDEAIPASAMQAYLAAPTPLNFWRRFRGMTQAELADAVGISQPYVCKLEQPETWSADAELLTKIAKALRITVDDLIPVEVERKDTPTEPRV